MRTPSTPFDDLGVRQEARQFVLTVYRSVINAQHSTSNFQRPSEDSSSLGVGRWVLGVGCSLSNLRSEAGLGSNTYSPFFAGRRV
jgi:hypothetical protein